MTYTLSIEDRVGTGVYLRAVVVKNPSFTFEEKYNPNSIGTNHFNSKGNEFETSFSIRHPFRSVAKVVVAKVVVEHYLKDVGSGLPEMEYDRTSVNEAQRTLFRNILKQEYDAIQKTKENGSQAESFPYTLSNPPSVADEVSFSNPPRVIVDGA